MTPPTLSPAPIRRLRRLAPIAGPWAAGVAAALLAGAPAGAQDQGEWNAPRTLALVEAARDVRQASAVDSTFTSYRSRAQGFVYFFLDRPDEEEHTLIKADQIALEVFWRAPDQTRQRIVGLRDEKVLPTNIRYHLDHLTVVQDDFQDLIRMGDGDEVGAVLHPAAPGAPTLYDYRLVDSLSLSYAGLPEPVRVYEVQVRPKKTELPGFVGALYLDRASGAIVRMAFTFTPASYVDPYLDYIRISLDNGLWMGRHWLPYRQEVELRRELPQLDFMAGSIIRGRWEVGRYEFNEAIPDFYFSGPRVTAAPERLRNNFLFEEGLYADLDREGLSPSPSLEEIQDQVRSMALAGVMDGLSPVRFHLSSFSDAVRRNRVEGWAFGLGATVRVSEIPLRLMGGYATAAERGWARANLTFPNSRGEVRLEGAWNHLVDMGPLPGASGLVNTVATLGGRDYLDPYWVRGGSATWSLRLGRDTRLDLTGRVEEHGSGRLAVDDEDTVFRPVRPVLEGTLRAGEVRLERSDQGRGAFGHLAVEVGEMEESYTGVHAGAGWSRLGPSHPLEQWVGIQGGWLSGGAPPQALHLLGGRGTLPGFAYRGTVANRYLLSRGWIRHTLREPWISLRLTGALGWSELADRALPAGWAADPDTAPGVRGSLGVGADLLWEVLQFDVARGLPDGEWTFYVSVTPKLAPWL